MRRRRSWAYFAQLGALLACAALGSQARGSCTAGATGVSFGTYNLLSPTPLTSTGTITVTCTKGYPVTVMLSPGKSGTYSPRSLGTGFSYNLYQDAAHSEIWGDGTGVSTYYTGKTTHGQPTITLTVYGEIPALQNPAPGSYTDTITVTVNY
jgi:spore coat protein U-like protein